jgi:hypothetical protein
MQPVWVQFLVLGTICAVLWTVLWGMGTTPRESIWHNAILGLVSGVFFAGFLIYLGLPMREALVDAVAGLDKTDRSQAIAAVTHGVVPADPAVRSSAIQLGAAYLRHQSPDQLKRQERKTWILLAVLAAAVIASAVMFSAQRLYFLVLLLFVLVTLPLGVLRTRRIQRNVALLGEDPSSR